jgi:hypothetical protein
MKNHFEREALWMVAILFGPLLVGLLAMIPIQMMRAHRYAPHAVHGSAIPSGRFSN